MRTMFLLVLSSLVVGALVLGPAFGARHTLVGADDTAPVLGYRYFERTIPLEVDPGALAILAPLLDAETLTRRLAAVGLTVSEITPEPLPGWVRVRHTSAGDLRSQLDRALEVAEVEFASPVFLLDGLPRYVTPWILAGPGSGVADTAFFAAVETWTAAEVETTRVGGFERIHRLRHASRDGLAVLDDANMLARAPGIEHAAPDWLSRGRKDLIPNDTLFGQQWGLRNIGQGIGYVFDQDVDADEAWDISTGDPSVVIVVFDDGVQTAHPDLNLLAGQDFTTSGSGGDPANACDNHGTAVAGCITAIIGNGIGVVGVAPDCRVRSAKIGISDLGSPCPSTFAMADSWLVNALGWAQTVGDVTNSSISLGPSASISNAYNSARANGVIHFASSGNSAATSIAYPSSLTSVNSVGALLPNGLRAGFSNTGSGLAFTAPGSQIATTDRTGSAGYTGGSYDLGFGGTSAASPFAAGVAALALSVEPSLTPTELEDLMGQSCVDKGPAGYDTDYGYGLVNARALLDSLDPTYGPPSITLISPSAGPVSGGNTVTILGAEIDPEAILVFGSQPGTITNWTSPQEIEVLVPPGVAGSVDVLLSQDSGSVVVTDGYLYSSNQLRLESFTAPIGGTDIPSSALATNDVALAGFSFAVEFDGSFIDVADVTNAGTITEDAEFFETNWDNFPVGGNSWWIAGVVMSFTQAIDIPPGTEVPVLTALYDIPNFAPPGTLVTLEIVDDGGQPPTDLVFSPGSGVSITPDTVNGLAIIVEGGFLRGDSNRDGAIDVGDPVYTLGYLFSSGPGVCQDAMDGNDDGSVDIGDAVFVLGYLFSSGPNPPAPWPNEGPDPTADTLGCD